MRRVYLFNQVDGLLLELQVAFLDHEFSSKSRNTQLALANDLSFFCRWCSLQKHKDPAWISPERRASQGGVALTRREVVDLARWCQKTAANLTKAIDTVVKGAHSIPVGAPVSLHLRNRRLRCISAYVQWLSIHLANPVGKPEAEASAQGESNRAFLYRQFKARLVANPKTEGPLALNSQESTRLREVLANSTVFLRDSHGARDKLIVELLLQGLRAGELLKVKVGDLDDRFDLGRLQISIVSVVRRPNDPDDSRTYEPAVKTRSGRLPIPKSLASALIRYVVGPRREAVDKAVRVVETDYLFVCHSGPCVGRPISQRNLSRIVAKLKGVPGLPSTISAHLLRHTHMTETYDIARQKGHNDQRIRELLLLRGRWSERSMMPAHYTQRTVMEEAAGLVEERDSRLGKI